MQVTTLLTSTTSGQLTESNIYQLDKYFIYRLIAVSAAHFDANIAILRKTVQN